MPSPACRPCLSTEDRLVTIAPVDIPAMDWSLYTDATATAAAYEPRSVASAVIADIASAGSEDPIQSRFDHPLH
jgi:hypothetical protein